MKKPLAITELVTLIANFISERFDTDTVAIIAAIFVQVGDTLATIAAVDALSNDSSIGGSDTEWSCSKTE